MNISVDLNYPIKDGTEIVFRSPVDCSQVTGLKLYFIGEDGNTTSQEFAFADAHGNNVGDIDHLFAENVAVKVILDVTTGMAFVQNADTNAYLEGRFEALAKAVNVPSGVQEEANELVDKSLSHEDTNLFRFLVFADAHHKTPKTGGYLYKEILAGTKELGQAVGAVLKTIGVDLVVNLGDTTWGSSGNDSATCLGEAKDFNRLVCDKIRGQAQLWTEGNHETEFLTASQIHALIYSHNKGLVQDADHWIEGYGYRDFENQKVRVICLNTNQGTASGNVSGMSDEQVKWFAEVALNMEGKTDWNVITMGHHPLSYNTVSLMEYAAKIVEAFVNGDNFSLTTYGGTTLAIDYSNKNCQYVGHFHGHAHAFSVVNMQKYVSSGVYKEIDAWEICIPNACYTRNNQYLGNTDNPYVARYSTEETYDKTDEDGNRTSFNLVTVCLGEKKIYADNYGAGIDREVEYCFDAYTNQLPMSQEIDSTEAFNGSGYMTGCYLSSSSPFYKTGSTNEWVTGCIPYTVDKPIYIKGVSFTTASHDRIYLFTDKATRVAPSMEGLTNVQKYYTVEELGSSYYKLTPISGAGLPDTAQYMRMSFTTGTPTDVIITIDEPIE